MPRGKKIFWTGIGSKEDGFHTKEEFLKIMRNQYPEVVYWRFKGDPPGIPEGKLKKDDINGWMHFAGANYT